MWRDLLELLDTIAGVIGGVITLVGAVAAGVATMIAWHRNRTVRRLVQPRHRPAAAPALAWPHEHGSFDGYISPLSKIYVRQRVVDAAVPTVTFAADRLLHDNRHLLLTGPAGSGKTAFAGFAPRALPPGRVARTGGTEVALAVRATALVGRPLPDVVMETYRATLTEETASRLPNRWLIIVDGLDRITDPNDRSRVLGLLRDWAAHGDRPYRLLLTSRPLAEEESVGLRGLFAEHRLLPFDGSDLLTFAERWFADRVADAERATRARDRFRVDLERSRLGPIAYNPLLVTLAALFWERRPGTLDRVEVMDRFVKHLLDGGMTVVDAAGTALRRRGRTGEAAADWLAEQVEEVLEAAADGWLRNRRPVEHTVSWLAEHGPSGAAELLPDWAGRIRALLVATGLFVTNGVDVEPITSGVAEYLAAGPLARSWQEASWLALIIDPATRGMASYALSRAAVPVDPFLTELAAGSPDRVLAAGHLLATGVSVSVSARYETLAALLRHWHGGVQPVAGGCLALLAELAATAEVREDVYAIAKDPNRSRQVRTAAATFIAVPALRQRQGDDTPSFPTTDLQE